LFNLETDPNTRVMKRSEKKEMKVIMNSIRSILTIAGILWSSSISAQAPDWSVNTAAYQYTMSIVAFLNVDHKTLVIEQDKVVALVGDEVRGVSNPIYISSADRYLAYLTISGNSETEKIEFKIYDSGNDKVIDVALKLDFKIDGQVGNVFQALSLASPPLNKEADIKAFSFSSVLPASTEINPGQVDIVLRHGQSLENLTPEFLLSEGARMYVDRTLVESGNATSGFSEPVFYSVLSEDESVFKTWQIHASVAQAGENSFFGSNVITPNGDGLNDFWIVNDAAAYDQADFKIYDANGRILFESTGYRNDWNGQYRGTALASGKYYFVIRDPVTNTVIKGDILLVY
jgi:gliding motility-associated-like protein